MENEVRSRSPRIASLARGENPFLALAELSAAPKLLALSCQLISQRKEVSLVLL